MKKIAVLWMIVFLFALAAPPVYAKPDQADATATPVPATTPKVSAFLLIEERDWAKGKNFLPQLAQALKLMPSVKVVVVNTGPNHVTALAKSIVLTLRQEGVNGVLGIRFARRYLMDETYIKELQENGWSLAPVGIEALGVVKELQPDFQYFIYQNAMYSTTDAALVKDYSDALLRLSINPPAGEVAISRVGKDVATTLQGIRLNP